MEEDGYSFSLPRYSRSDPPTFLLITRCVFPKKSHFTSFVAAFPLRWRSDSPLPDRTDSKSNLRSVFPAIIQLI